MSRPNSQYMYLFDIFLYIPLTIFVLRLVLIKYRFKVLHLSTTSDDRIMELIESIL